MFKEFQSISDNILSFDIKEICQYLAGFADSEATVDLRNQIISYSISNKKLDEAKKIKEALEKVSNLPIKIRTAGKLELKIEVHSIQEFNKRIGRFMRHPEKLNKLSGKFLSERDREILNIIKERKFKAKELSEHLKIHPDSSRRIIRFFKKQNLL